MVQHSETMRAALCEGPGRALEIRSVPVPSPGPGQLLVKMESCGVCHSDLHLRNGDESLPDSFYPLILGHEGVGRVCKIGPNTLNAPALNTRVGLPWLFNSCLSCKPCLTGHETFCQSQTARGVQHHGAFAEYAVLDAQFACVIPDEIDSISGAPLLCAGLTAWSAIRKTRLSPTSTVLIIGAGGLGQHAVIIAKAQGAKVLVVDQDEQRLKEAIRLGADAAHVTDECTVEKVLDAGGADVIFNFAPSPHVWSLIEGVVKPMSDIVCVALVQTPVELSMMWLIDGGHRVFGSSVGTRQELAEFLQFATRIRSWPNVESIRLSDVNAGLDRLASGDFTGRLCVDFSLSDIE